MSRTFSVQRGATRVVFGAGSSTRIPEHIAPLSVKRVLVVSTRGREAAATELAGTLGGEVFAHAREHVPVETVEEAQKVVDRTHADGVLALGGGSAIGLAKALARSQALQVIVVPTTYSGSEMTPVYGITEGNEKRTGRDERVRPSLVIYDPVLTRNLPREVTVNSLWNAMAHAVEALWMDSDRVTARVAEDALGLLSSALRRLAVDLGDDAARVDALEGAYLAGIAFADTGAGLHHKLCHVLGGMFGLPHAATHAVMLPHVARAKRGESRAMLAIARALGVIDPIAGLEALARDTGAPRALSALGMPHEGIDRVLDAVSFDRIALKELLERAFVVVDVAAAPAVRGPGTIDTVPAGVQESEALEGALPRRQNTPRPAPRGLYPELVNLTPFTSRRADNLRLWLYRIRPSFSHGPLLPLPTARFSTELTDVEPNRTRWRALEVPRTPTDFLDGLVTLGASGAPTDGPGFAVHLYAGNKDMADRCFANVDGDVLIVPQTGTLDVRTELGWLRASPGMALMIPRAIKFAVGMTGPSRGWMLEVFGTRLKLPERGPLGSNGLADARHLRAPVASFEDRLCPGGYQFVTKAGGKLFAAMQEHSPFDVVAWHGNSAPFTYDLSLFNAMGTVNFDHSDPSIHTVLTAPLDDHGRAVADFVVFPGRWEVAEHTFRPPSMHRNAASEINCVVRDPAPAGGYDPGITFLTPLLTGHGISTKSYDAVLSQPDDVAEKPRRIPDESLWVMFESALQFRLSQWARETELRDPDFLAMFAGMRSRFTP
jgi:homogentisate 1,2-dioxygenase